MADYLKRYASKDNDDAGEEKRKKKKKKKDKEKTAAKLLPRMRIIDTDVYVPTADEERAAKGDGAVVAVEDDLKDQLVETDELPQVEGLEDDRPAEVVILETFKKSGRWKQFQTIKDEPEDDCDDTFRTTNSEAVKTEPDQSSLRIKKEPTSDDEGHQRKERRRHDSENSPPRRRHDSDDSPPRRRHDSDNSPPRKRHDSDDSPPRKRHDSDNSPPRRRQDSDASPPRRKKSKTSSDVTIKKEVDSDESPPRKVSRADSDESPPRKIKREDSDESPPRKVKREDSDESPPRKGDFKQMKKTLDGKRAGLQSAKGLKEEMLSFREREKNAILNLDNSKSGRGAETVVRGRLKDKEREKKEKEEKTAEVRKQMEEKYSRWNKGVKQVHEAGKKMDDDLYEMSKPLARTEDDTDRDALLKEVMREDDPMAKYITKAKEKQKTGKRRPVYQGPQPPPNRYGIPPGYRWDGVDRSNGFENKLMTRASARKAIDEEAYKWSVEDM